MEKPEIIVTIVAAVITSGLFNVFLTHFLHGRELRQEQKIGYQGALGEKISEALLSVRDIELKCSSIEIYNIEEELEKDSFDSFKDITIYPAITGNEDRFFEFFGEITAARKKYEKYLGFKEAAYLYYMERYCENFIHMAGTYKKSIKELGAVFVTDFQMWQKSFEKIIIKRINKPKYKIYDKNNKRWEKAKKKILKSLWEKSLLCKFKNGEDISEVKILNAMIIEKDEAKALKLMEEVYEDMKKHPIKHFLKKLKNKMNF